MEFAGDIAFWQRRIAEITKGAEHRIAAFQALEIVPGETILDIGCGGGALTREIALALGAGGRAIGLDRSPEQLTAAREVCADVASAELVEADATGLPFDDASVDGFISINTLEYVPQVERALQEAHRVLKAGGRAVVLSVLWDV